MPLKEWKPTSRQDAFLSIPDSVFEGLYGGAAGGGKTETLLMIPVVKKTKQNFPLYTHPRYKALFLRRTFPELDNEVIPRSKEICIATGATYQDQKKRWTWPSGAILQFGHCEHEKDVVKYDTSEWTNILWDEATSFTPYQYRYLTFSRCRTSCPDLVAYVRAGTNPGNVGHTYFRKRFIDPHKNGGVILRETRQVNNIPVVLTRIFVPSKVQDNPHLLKADPGYVARLNQLPEKERKAKAEGDWYTFSGQVFHDFREMKMPDEPENAIHVIEPFLIPHYWAKILSIDWGFSALTVAGWYAINPSPDLLHRAKIYKYREYTALKTNISKWASDVARLSTGEELSDIALDPSAWGHRGEEYTIAEQFEQNSGLRPRKADNDRIGGKLALQEHIKWTDDPIQEIPVYSAIVAQQVYSKGGQDALNKYLSSFIPSEKVLRPKLQIFNTCHETIRVLPMCMYKKDKDKPTTDSEDEGNSEDVEEFRGDDAYDETRYGIKACQYYLEHGQNEHQRLTQVAKICSVVEQGRPSPSELMHFYRKMSDLEAATTISNRPIKRFHGPRLKHANFR